MYLKVGRRELFIEATMEGFGYESYKYGTIAEWILFLGCIKIIHSVRVTAQGENYDGEVELYAGRDQPPKDSIR